MGLENVWQVFAMISHTVGQWTFYICIQLFEDFIGTRAFTAGALNQQPCFEAGFIAANHSG